MTRHNSTYAFTLGLLAILGTPLSASTLYDASAYNVFVFGGFTATGSDTGGAIAAGGNAAFNSGSGPIYYSIDDGSPNSSTTPTLVVGGEITSGTANIYGSDSAYVGNLAGGGNVQFNPSGPTIETGTPPFSFSTDQTELTNYSNFLATLTPTGTAAQSGSTVTLTGTSNTLNVFTISASLLGGNNTVNIVAPAGATVLINVTGTTVNTTTAGITINGSGVGSGSSEFDDVLFNFYQATSLTFDGGFLGSVLAPGANVSATGYQQVDGQLIANSFDGNAEFHDYLFTGTLPPPTSTPEPGSLAMLGAGLLALGFARRKRKA